jgi:hypothetical protein
MIKAMEVLDNWEQHEKIFSKNKLTKNYMPPETTK